MLQLIGTSNSNNNVLFNFQDTRGIMFATSEEIETHYMATYSLLVHAYTNHIIDELDAILQGGTTIVFINNPTEYHDDGGSSSTGPSHR